MAATMPDTSVPVVVFASLVMVVGVVGNSVVCYVCLCRLRRSVLNNLVLSLATLDLIGCVLCVPLEVTELRNRQRRSEPELCIAQRFLRTILIISSGFVLVAIATERYRRICQPLSRHITSRQCRVAVATIVASAAILAFPSLFLFDEIPVTLRSSSSSSSSSSPSSASSLTSRGDTGSVKGGRYSWTSGGSDDGQPPGQETGEGGLLTGVNLTVTATECGVRASARGSGYPAAYFSALFVLFFAASSVVGALYARIACAIWRPPKLQTDLRAKSASLPDCRRLNAARGGGGRRGGGVATLDRLPGARGGAATLDRLPGARGGVATLDRLPGARGGAATLDRLPGARGGVATLDRLPGARGGAATLDRLPGARGGVATLDKLPGARAGGLGLSLVPRLSSRACGRSRVTDNDITLPRLSPTADTAVCGRGRVRDNGDTLQRLSPREDPAACGENGMTDNDDTGTGGDVGVSDGEVPNVVCSNSDTATAVSKSGDPGAGTGTGVCVGQQAGRTLARNPGSSLPHGMKLHLPVPMSLYEELTRSLKIRRKRDSLVAGPGGLFMLPTPSLRRRKRAAYSRKRTTAIMFFMTLTSVVSYLPYVLVSIVSLAESRLRLEQRGAVEKAFLNLCLKSFLISSAVNPLIYGFCNRKFKKECAKLWQGFRCGGKDGDREDTSDTPPNS